MIELQKHVLNQVHHNKELFIKELIKSKKWLSYTEQENLKEWLLQSKFQKYHQIIEATLSPNYQIAS
ncbi:hypothetical protein FHR24_001211 [Wenyingzhuangia heitensis]|uniref:Uncharacterized protein n=1 Tax=Wenyingzhuangia heitensis TaxID=1487859 RepID=A0ABX0U7I5_9FLAO|nr:hypothetical protein [Wenyingzhuangia heitensis]NIJ44772.1 hypothetical protein [Wenyingzhuangia heitensis]